MSIPLQLLKKVRCRLLCADSGSPVPGVVVSLLACAGTGDEALRLPLGSLRSDASGYLAFDLQPLLERGVTAVERLLLVGPRLPHGEVDLLATLFEATGGAGAPEGRVTALGIFGSGAGSSSPTEPAPGSSLCLIFPVRIHPHPDPDRADAPPECTAAPLPSVQSPDLCDYEASPYSFVAPNTAKLGDGPCESIVPASLPLQEHRFYKVVVRREDEAAERDRAHGRTKPVKVAAVKVTDALSAQTPRIKFAEVLEFRQHWFALGHALGEIKYSLALAPGETTQIAVIDWVRQDTAARTDAVIATEYMDHALKRDRAIEETIDSALRESQGGSSFMFGTSGQATIPLESMTLSFSHALGVGVSNSWGNRDLEANSLQDLHDGVRQQSAYTRSLNSTVIVQATQAEQNALLTRKVANHNHCHALTIQYYEVLRHFRVRTAFTRRRKAVLVPFEPFVFTWELALRFRSILERVLIDPALRNGFDAAARLNLAPDIYTVPPGGKPLPTSPQSEAPAPSILSKTLQVTGVLGQGVGSGMSVKAGDRIRITASGFLTMSWLGWTKTPNGDSELAEARSSFLAPGLQKYSLIYKIGPAGTWRQAGSFAEATADRDGEIVFGVNDTLGDFADNQGGGHDYWTVTLEVPSHEPAAPSAPQAPETAAPELGPAGPSRESDALQQARLLMHLNGNQGYYNRCVWVMQSPEERRLRVETALGAQADALDGFDETPIAVSGNYVAFGYDGPLAGWQAQRADDPKTPLEDIVTLPTRGLFAEAQLGHCNACEERDPTRMWDWREMTAETPPEIGNVTPGPRGTAPSITPTPLPGNVIQITQPAAAPDPGGLAAALRVMGTADIFRDMSGLDEVSALLQTLAQESSEDKVKALAQQAKAKLDAAKGDTAGAKGGAATEKTRSPAGEPDSAKQVDRVKAIEYAVDKGLLDEQSALGAAKGVFGGEVIPTAGPATSIEKLLGSGDTLLRGVDVSHWQSAIDWQRVRRDDIGFAFMKATEGTNEDARFQENWRNSQDAGLIVGAYHYFRAGVDPARQADAFIRAVGTRRGAQLPPAVDVERENNDLTALGLSTAECVSRLKAFCDALEDFYGTRPIIYTGGNEWKYMTGNSDEFADYPLWVAHPARGDAPGAGGPEDFPGNEVPGAPVEPLVPPAWRGGWYFWQYSWKGRVDGIVPLVDLNLYNGSYVDLTRFAGFKLIYEI